MRPRFRLRVHLIVALLAVLLAFSVKAEDASELIAKLGTAADFAEKADIVESLAGSGSPLALRVLDAMGNGRLYYRADGAVAISDEAGETFIDPATDRPLEGATAATLEKVTVNNMLRRKISGATARLGLFAPDTDTRIKAAEGVFVAHEDGALPIIEEALETEQNASVKAVLEQARAAIVLQGSASDEDKLAAIKIIQQRGGESARNVLTNVQEDASPVVAAAADRALTAIDSNMVYWSAVQNLWYGLSLGSVLLLAAIGLAITMGVMGVINMAHGEMVMLGAYTTYLIQGFIQSTMPSLTHISLLLAVPAAFLVAGGVGVAIERTIIRFLYGRALETLLATWGLSLILQQTVRSIFGPTNKTVTSPSWMSGTFQIGQLNITNNRLWIIVFSLAVMGILMLVLKKTRFGLQTRAVTQNRQMAAAMGIRTDWIDAFTFGLGSGIAGIAGVALSQLDNVSPNLGQSYIIDSFMVVVFGGVGNLWGTLVGSMTLGIANKFLEPYAGAVLGKIFVLIFIILFIQRRPRGLFALKGRAIEN